MKFIFEHKINTNNPEIHISTTNILRNLFQMYESIYCYINITVIPENVK